MSYKIGFVGLPSSGKTTSAEYTTLMAGLRGGFSAEMVPEYARIHMQMQGKHISSAREQYHVTEFQKVLEEELGAKNPHFLIIDSPVFMGEAFARLYYPNCAEMEDFQRLSKENKYDLLFWTEPLPYIEDGIRFQTPEDLVKLNSILEDIVNEYHVGELIRLPADQGVRNRIIAETLRERQNYLNRGSKFKLY